MHDTAFLTALEFIRVYSKSNSIRILDVGGRPAKDQLSIGEAIRSRFPQVEYTSLDIAEGPGVDAVYRLGEAFPFPGETFDLVISTSCFEHDPCFWVTFCEMCRVLAPDGNIYVNAPANGSFHRFPGDSWRFYGDAGQSLAYWAGRNGIGVQVLESFHVLPCADQWIDYVCIWGKSENLAQSYVLSDEIRSVIGPLQLALPVRTMQMQE